MPPLETADLYQRALLWEEGGSNDQYGQPRVNGTPVEIWCRWNIGRKSTFDAQGNPIALDGEVMLSRAVTVGSIMWLAPDATYSALEQFLGTGSGGEGTELMEVRTYDETRDIKGRNVQYSAGLVWFRDTLPETV